MVALSSEPFRFGWLRWIFRRNTHQHTWSLVRSETLVDDEGDRAGKRYTSQCACGEVRTRSYPL